jgi:hypothetical protein
MTPAYRRCESRKENQDDSKNILLKACGIFSTSINSLEDTCVFARIAKTSRTQRCAPKTQHLSCGIGRDRTAHDASGARISLNGKALSACRHRSNARAQKSSALSQQITSTGLCTKTNWNHRLPVSFRICSWLEGTLYNNANFEFGTLMREMLRLHDLAQRRVMRIMHGGVEQRPRFGARQQRGHRGSH